MFTEHGSDEAGFSAKGARVYQYKRNPYARMAKTKRYALYEETRVIIRVHGNFNERTYIYDRCSRHFTCFITRCISIGEVR